MISRLEHPAFDSKDKAKIYGLSVGVDAAALNV